MSNFWNLPFRRDCDDPAKFVGVLCGCKCEKLLVTGVCCLLGCSGGATQTPSACAADDDAILSIVDELCECGWPPNAVEVVFAVGAMAKDSVSIGCARWAWADCKKATICLLLLGGSCRAGYKTIAKRCFD